MGSFDLSIWISNVKVTSNLVIGGQLEHLLEKIIAKIHFLIQFSQFFKKNSFTRLRSLARTISLWRLVCFNSKCYKALNNLVFPSI